MCRCQSSLTKGRCRLSQPDSNANDRCSTFSKRPIAFVAVTLSDNALKVMRRLPRTAHSPSSAGWRTTLTSHCILMRFYCCWLAIKCTNCCWHFKAASSISSSSCRPPCACVSSHCSCLNTLLLSVWSVTCLFGDVFLRFRALFLAFYGCLIFPTGLVFFLLFFSKCKCCCCCTLTIAPKSRRHKCLDFFVVNILA